MKFSITATALFLQNEFYLKCRKQINLFSAEISHDHNGIQLFEQALLSKSEQ
jgi:hypothetical protein